MPWCRDPPLTKIKIALIFFTFSLCSCPMSVTVDKKKIPPDLLLGVGTSAYQTEGAYNIDGKGLNTWDHYLQEHPELVLNCSNGNIACDAYHKYKEDVRLLKEMGVDHYRFSISWTRVLPDGFSNNINKKGLLFYNNLIDELLRNGIQPMVTMFHWDLPQKLQDLGGWLNEDMADYFEDYAKVLFDNFGDRVKYWITMNSFWELYENDASLPIVKQHGVAVYKCVKVHLLAHAKAFRLYDEEYRSKQNGKVGIVAASGSSWYSPASNSPEDLEATERSRLFRFGLTLNPLLHPDGDFPKIVKDRILQVSKKEGFQRSRLPLLSSNEIELLKGATDFVGLNIYSAELVKDAPELDSEPPSYDKDVRVDHFCDPNWKSAKSSWLKYTPWAIREFLVWIKDQYNNPEIIVTENGVSDDGRLDDQDRIKFFEQYIGELLRAIYEDKVNVKAYTVWSLLDNFEWTMGYSEKFGIHKVDFDDPDRKRTPKASAKWYKEVIKNRKLLNN